MNENLYNNQSVHLIVQINSENVKNMRFNITTMYRDIGRFMFLAGTAGLAYTFSIAEWDSVRTAEVECAVAWFIIAIFLGFVFYLSVGALYERTVSQLEKSIERQIKGYEMANILTQNQITKIGKNNYPFMIGASIVFFVAFVFALGSGCFELLKAADFTFFPRVL